MRYIYFTKSLQTLDVPGLIAFAKDVGLDGFDLAVRPGFPVHPDNAIAELPKAAKAFGDAGLVIGLVTAPTNMNDAESAAARALFDACNKAGVAVVKIGYFPYQADFNATLTAARRRLAGFAKLAEKSGVRACYHTHSGNYLGNNGAALRLLLDGLDPHHIGAFVDTGHLAVNGGPIRMEVELVRNHLSLVAIKDMIWERTDKGWQHHVAPAGDGIVRWNEVAEALRERGYDGTVSLHAEYETKSLEERKHLARRELEFLKRTFSQAAGASR